MGGICSNSRYPMKYIDDSMLASREVMLVKGLLFPPPLWIIYSEDSDMARRCGISALSDAREARGSRFSDFQPQLKPVNFFEQSRLSWERGEGGRAAVVYVLDTTDCLLLMTWIRGCLDGSGANKPFAGLLFALYCCRSDPGVDLHLYEFDSLVLSLGGLMLLPPGDDRLSFPYWNAALQRALMKSPENEVFSPVFSKIKQ